MTEDNKHWTSKVKTFKLKNFDLVEDTLNEFYKDKFVIATQIWPLDHDENYLVLIVVYYKVPPVGKAGN